jgi:PAS domain S-box-containing protein
MSIANSHAWEYSLGDALFLITALCLIATAIGALYLLRHQARKYTDALKKTATALANAHSEILALTQKAALINDKLQQTLAKTKKSRLALLSVLDDERRVSVERSKLSAAIEQAAEAVLTTDTAGTIQYVNPAFTAITGYSREEVVGQNPRFLKSGKQDAAFYQRMWATLRGGNVWRGHFINRRKDGALYEEEACISPVRDDANTIVNYVSVNRDVTREIQREAQLVQGQKMESVGRLAGGVAHDFNNLLMGILGYTEMCRDQIPPDHSIREWLDQITHIAQRSAEITRQLLAFARKQDIAPKVLDLNDAVVGMLELLRRLIGEDIHLVWTPGANLHSIKIDPAQVDQILANLCINARDAIDGVGKITLETRNVTVDSDFCTEHVDALPGNYVMLTISDDGRGMDAETLAKIFEPFFTTKDRSKGTGLGLSTVYGIAKQNTGFICVTSEVGKGTTFNLYLPEVAARAEKTTNRSAGEVPRGQNKTVLLTEDNQPLCRIIQWFLKDLGYNVLAAETPTEALKLAKQTPDEIHLLLTDVVMPVMDGHQLAQQIEEIKPGVRILYMSGYTADVIAEHGVLDQNVAFIAKPFTRNDLASKLHSILTDADAGPDRDGLRFVSEAS